MIRLIDLISSLFGLILLSPILLLLLFGGYLDTGKPLIIQERVGKNKKKFSLVKFRTMSLETNQLASHLVSSKQVTNYGGFLRRTKLDELPQLWNVFIGDMSLVGPRPNLLNQIELIKERDKLNIYNVRPGITGLAQIKKIDMSTPKLLAETDYKMILKMNLFRYFTFIFKTIFGAGKGDAVKD